MKITIRNVVVLCFCCITVLLLCCACSHNKEIIHKLSLGDGLPTVKLHGNYYEAEIPDDVKTEGAIHYYATDNNTANIIVYRSNWKESGKYNNIVEYFADEAKTFNATIYKGAWEDAGFPECLSYVAAKEYRGEMYIYSGYGLQDGDYALEVFYLNKTDEILSKDAKVAFYIPKIIAPVDMTDEDRDDQMIAKRMSTSASYPSVNFYCWEATDEYKDIQSNENVAKIAKNYNVKNIQKVEVNGYKALKGDMAQGVSAYAYECNGYIVLVRYIASTDEAKAMGEVIAASIHNI